MDPYLRQQIDESHELLKGSLYNSENDVHRRLIDEAFLITERPSKSEIDSVIHNFSNCNPTMPINILAIYESKFNIQDDIPNKWLAEAVARMAKYLLDYPKLAYVNYVYLLAIDSFEDILKVDEYRSFWSDFSAGSKGITGTDLTQLKLQPNQEVKAELKDQLKQEVKAELKEQLKREVKAELKYLLEHDVKLELKDQLKQNWE